MWYLARFVRMPNGLLTGLFLMQLVVTGNQTHESFCIAFPTRNGLSECVMSLGSLAPYLPHMGIIVLCLLATCTSSHVQEQYANY